MIVNAEAAQAALEHMNENSGPVFKIFNDPRVTKIGAILRRTSIDELPQLFNILRGEMSFVGPRPLNMRDVGRFSEAWLMRRFSVKPGLTCLWQISGRSNVSFDRWIALDLHYIDNWSLQMDLKILAMTDSGGPSGNGGSMTRFRRIRIVYMNHTGMVSGAEKVLVNMVKGLDRARYEPYRDLPCRWQPRRSD